MKASKRNPELKVEQTKEKLRGERAKNRKLRQRIKELEGSRDELWSKVKRLRQQIKAHKGQNRRWKGVAHRRESIGCHKYDVGIVSLCLSLYASAGCSYRAVRQVLLCIQLELGLVGMGLPSKSSIENWVHKLGYHYYLQSGQDLRDPYAIIIDESMVVGQERMLVALGVMAQKQNSQALSLEDVRVLGFAVRASWKWGDVKSFVQEVQAKMGTKASYVVCDGGVNLCKGMKESDLTRICDIGHEVCKLTEQTYLHDERYEPWSKAVIKVRFQVFMKETAYLLPPKQRTVARFTNLCHVTDWALNMLKALPQLNDQEKQTYGWMREHQTFVEELASVFAMNQSILQLIKNDGLSMATIEACIKICNKAPGSVPWTIRNKIIAYLQGEKAKLPHQKACWHASSDVLESLFGKYKARAASNPLNGVTARVLTLALMTFGNDTIEQLRTQVKPALEGISLANIEQWKSKHLSENQIVRRKRKFKN